MYSRCSWLGECVVVTVCSGVAKVGPGRAQALPTVPGALPT